MLPRPSPTPSFELADLASSLNGLLATNPLNMHYYAICGMCMQQHPQQLCTIRCSRSVLAPHQVCLLS